MQSAPSPAPLPLPRANPSRTLIPVFLYFLSAGVPTVMLGPILPALIQRWHIQDAQAGTLFTASFIGQFCGAWFATRNLRASVIFGSAITAMGCAGMAWIGFGLAHVALFTVGLGLGAGLTAGNVIAGTVVPAKRARLIAALNVAWGLGAIACPLLVRFSSAYSLESFFFATACVLAVASLLSITIPRSTESPLAKTFAGSSTSQSPQTKSRIPLPGIQLFVFAASIFLYVGVENCLGGWLPSYATRTNPGLQASNVALCFWIAELSGRILTTALVPLISEVALYRLGLTVLILTEILLCTIANVSTSGVIALTLFAALSLAPLYPLMISFLLARTGNHAKLGVLFAGASIGGATLPWLTGVVSTYFHGLRSGLLVPALAAILLLCFSSVVTARPTASTRS